MAVPEQTPYIEHTGNGATTSFSLGFQCESKDHLIVLVDEIEPPIATWSLTGGNVVFTTAPAAGKKIKLQRNTPFNRNAEYQSFNNSFRPQTVNIDFDRIWWKLQELGVADWLMKLYVDRLHQQQEQKINDLKGYVDDRDDEHRSYFMEEIRKQGVALDQLDDYYNYLMQRLAQIAVDKGWDAAFVVDASGKTQQQINDSIAVKFISAKEIGLTKWTDFKKPPYTNKEYEDAYNNGLRLAQAIKDANDAGYSEVVLERGNYPFLYSNPFSTSPAHIYHYSGAIVIDGIRDMTINFGGSTLFVLFDSTTKNPYNLAPVAPIYGASRYANNLIFEKNTRNVKFKNGTLRGDQYTRSWVSGENMTDDTQGHWRHSNCVNTSWEDMKYTGFRADGIAGNPAGTIVTPWQQLEVWNSGDVVNGVVTAKVGAYATNKLDLQGKNIIDNTVILRATAYPGGAIKFGSHLVKVVFYDANSNFISDEITAQTRRISLPLNCRYIQFVGYGIPATAPTYTFERYIELQTGNSYIANIYNCDFYENHRGGVANLGSATLIDTCRFKDIGLSKLGFPEYGDTTIYAVNFEDTYDNNLRVTNCEVENTKQGVLFNGQDLKVDNCIFRDITWGGVVTYGALSSIIDNNTFENVGRALEFSRTALFQRKKIIFTNNTLKNSGLRLHYFYENQLHRAIISGNIIDGTQTSVNSGVFEIIADQNLEFNNNIIYNISSERGENLTLSGLSRMSENTFVFDSGVAYRTYLNINKLGNGHGNVVKTYSDSATIEGVYNKSGEQINIRGFDFVGSRGYKVTRTNKSKGWSSHTDVAEFYNCNFDAGNLVFEGFDGQNFYDLKVKQVGGSYVNGAYFSMQTRETASYSGSTWNIVFDGVTFDISAATRIFYNSYALIGSMNVQFINCKFISDTPKSLAFIQGQTAKITAVATNCSFISVTNTDSILQIAGTAKTTYDPPSLANGVQQSTTVTLAGAKVGDNINVSFDKPLSGTRIWGEVTSANTVTIYHRNDTGAVVDVASGTLTVKLI